MLVRLLKNQKIRYLIAGGSSFLLEYSIFVVTQIVTGNIYFSNSISFLAGLTVSFILHKYWSFAGVHTQKTHNQAFAYVFLAATNLVLSNIIIGLLVTQLQLSPFISKVATMALIVLWNYYIFAKFIFRGHSTPEN